MVDLDKLKDEAERSNRDPGTSGGGSSSSGSKSSSGSSSSPTKSNSGSGADVHSEKKEELLDPEAQQVGQVAKDWADEGGDFNYDAGASGSFNQYKSKQVKEIKELHSNVHEMSTGNMNDFDEFTLYFHALFINLAKNRVGVYETIKDNFDVSDKEALKRTNAICKEAGEGQMIESLIQEMTENLAEV